MSCLDFVWFVSPQKKLCLGSAQWFMDLIVLTISEGLGMKLNMIGPF